MNSNTSSIVVTTGFKRYTMYPQSENERVGGHCTVFVNHQTIRRLIHDTRGNSFLKITRRLSLKDEKTSQSVCFILGHRGLYINNTPFFFFLSLVLFSSL